MNGTRDVLVSVSVWCDDDKFPLNTCVTNKLTKSIYFFVLQIGISNPEHQQKLLSAVQQMHLDRVDLHSIRELGAAASGYVLPACVCVCVWTLTLTLTRLRPEL